MRALSLAALSVLVALSSRPTAAQATSYLFTPVHTAVSPSARAHVGLAFDGARAVWVLFGGDGNGFSNTDETWTFDGTDWTQMSPSLSPPGRQDAVLVYDHIRQEVVLFGGWDSGLNGILGDTWTWDGTTWTQKQPSQSPPLRTNSIAAWDPVLGAIVMHGGWDGTQELGDTWAWDGTDWSHLTDGPITEVGTMWFDDATGYLMQTLGAVAGTPSQDVYELDGLAWTAVASHPDAYGKYRCGVYDSRTSLGLTFGGDISCTDCTNALSSFDGNAWQVVAATNLPVPQWADKAEQDPVTGRILVFGGRVGCGLPEDYIDSVFWLDPITPVIASATPFGTGCGDPEFIISPTAGSLPIIGQTQLTDIANIPMDFVAMSLGLSNSVVGPFVLPLALDDFGMTGCTLYQDLSVDLAESCTATGTGTASHVLPIPLMPQLQGLVIYLQAWAVTDQNPGGIATSNAIGLTLANQ